MDIRKWLAETEDPVLSEQPGAEHYLLPKHPDNVLNAKRRRKRSSSDSSLLKASSLQSRRKGVLSKKRDHHGVFDATGDGHSDASRSGSIASAPSSSVRKHYARKPRRKTRADKYDTESTRTKERGWGQQLSGKSESRKSRRKSRRQKDNKTHNGVGREFQASNVSRDRLTLKPSENIGLFGKGRTSTSLRGRGLPDLVFSEMEFLRNHRGSNDNTTQTLDAKKKRRKDHARTREEDISAFFTTVRPVLKDTDGNIRTKSRRLTGSSAGAKADNLGRTRDPYNASVTAVPPAESEGHRSHLGLGSKAQRSQATSHISWSESLCSPVDTSERLQNTSAGNSARVDAQNREADEAVHGRSATGHRRAPSSILRDRVTATSNGLRLSSVAPVPEGLLRSQNLPERSSSSRPNVVDRAAYCHTNERITSLSAMAPVLQSRSHIGPWEASKTVGSIELSFVDDNTEVMRAQWSKGQVRESLDRDCPPQLPQLGGPMQHSNETFETRPGQALPGGEPRRRFEAQPSTRSRGSARQDRHKLHRTRAQASTAHFEALENQPSGLSDSSGLNFHVPREQRQRLPIRLGLEEVGTYHCPDGISQPCMSKRGELDHEDFGGFSDKQMSHGLMEEAGDDVEGLNCVADGVHQARERQYTSAVTPGFWRPNRLY